MIVEALEHLDKILTLSINNLGNTWLNYFMIFMSNREVWYPLYLTIIFFLFYRLGFKIGLICLLALILTVALCDQTSYWVKHFVARLRPCYDYYMLTGRLHLLEGRTSYYGFFSAHAANSFGIAVASIMCFLIDKRKKYRIFSIMILLWAFTVSLSRIFVGKHYLGDVIVGAFCGVLIGLFIGFVLHKIFVKKENPCSI